MENKELEIRKEIETIGKAKLKFEWNMDTILIAFTEFEDPREGLAKTIEYWEEFLNTETYEWYWESWREKERYHNWEFHLEDVMCLFKMFIRGKIMGDVKGKKMLK